MRTDRPCQLEKAIRSAVHKNEGLRSNKQALDAQRVVHRNQSVSRYAEGFEVGEVKPAACAVHQEAHIRRQSQSVDQRPKLADPFQQDMAETSDLREGAEGIAQ